MRINELLSFPRQSQPAETLRQVHPGEPRIVLRAKEIPPSEKNRFDCEIRNLHALSLLIARSALTREESRGSHYRSDFPFRDDEKLQKHSLIAKDHDVTYEK